MTNKQRFIIVAVVLLLGCLLVFLMQEKPQNQRKKINVQISTTYLDERI